MYTIYGKEDCVYCKKAVALAREKGLEFASINLAHPINAKLVDELKAKGFTQVPQIYRDEVYHVGGYQEFYKEVTGQDAED